MNYTLKKELLAYFGAKANRTDEENRLYNRLTDELQAFEITTVDREDLRERGFDADGITDGQMLEIADKMCGCYLDRGGFTEDLAFAAEEIGLKQQ